MELPLAIRLGAGVLAGVLLGVPARLCAEPSPPPAPAASAAPSVVSAVDAARKRVADGDLAGATLHLAAYVATNGRDVEAARYLGDLYYRAGDTAAAERTFRAILRVDPNDQATHDRLGGMYAAQDRPAEALEQFQLSLPSVTAYGHLVELHRRLGDLATFEAGYRRAADASPLDAGSQYAIGVIYRAERRTADAVVFLQRALRLSPRSCAILSELGSALIDADDVSGAVTTLQRCLDGDPNNYAALVNLADAEIARERDAAARKLLDRAHGAYPERPEALVDLGYIEDDAGRWQSAIRYYLRAIELDPLAREAYVDLGYDYGQHRLFTLAEAALLKGLSVSPADGRLHYLLAVTYVDQGKRDLARGEFRRAASSDEPEVARAASRDLSSLQ
jgi:tetratricopeptide (TPR) repeat protein